MHSYSPSSFLRSAGDWRFSRPWGGFRLAWIGIGIGKGGGESESEGRWQKFGRAYIFSLGVALQVWLDRFVLLVELGQVRNEIFDDVGVG